MAKILGESGGYAQQSAAGYRLRQLRLGFILIGLLGLVGGMSLSSLWSLAHPPRWLSQVGLFLSAAAVFALVKWGHRKLDELEREQTKWQRGAEGESTVGKILAGLPDDYHVINDLQVPGQHSNLDHVVIGPTGVFVVDAKNWRGVVQADGRGELLLNDKATDKREVRNFVARMMGVKEQILVRMTGAKPFFHGLFVFTAARVEAAWGRTGQVYCLRAEQLRDYIVENETRTRLSPEQVQQIAQAFASLVGFDRDYSDGVIRVNRGKVTPIRTDSKYQLRHVATTKTLSRTRLT